MTRGGRTKDREAPSERRCLVTGEVQPKAGLIRFVAGPDGVVIPDHKLPDADKAAVTQALSAASITSHIDEATDAVTVNEEDYSRARLLLAGQFALSQAL